MFLYLFLRNWKRQKVLVFVELEKRISKNIRRKTMIDDDGKSKTTRLDRKHSSVVEDLASMYKVLSSIPSITEQNSKRKHLKYPLSIQANDSKSKL
jgi:hypothetical protein